VPKKYFNNTFDLPNIFCPYGMALQNLEISLSSSVALFIIFLLTRLLLEGQRSRMA